MIRRRRCAGLVALAVMLLGLLGGAAAAVAGGDCCAGGVRAQDAPEPTSPCHSVAPTSCCEPSAAGPLPTAPGAPVVLEPGSGLAPCLAACVAPSGEPLTAPAIQRALASVVLRL